MSEANFVEFKHTPIFYKYNFSEVDLERIKATRLKIRHATGPLQLV